MKDGEDHQEMYRRLKAIATTFKNLGAHHIDDEWIKMKYILTYIPFEPTDLKSVQGKHNFHEMTSNQVMQEMQAYKVAAQNAEDARARAMGMQRSSNLALKASVVEREVPLQARLLFLPRGFWSSFMWISLVLLLIQVLVGRNIV
jgi:hypothetical protein